MKKTLVILLCLFLVVAALPIHADAGEYPTNNISKYDLRLLVSEFVIRNIESDEYCTWNLNMKAKETPLYDLNDRIVAYYVALDNADGTPNGHIVVNASQNNPTVLEYSYDTTHETFDGSKVYYATMGTYFLEKNTAKTDMYLAGTDVVFSKNTWNSAFQEIWGKENEINVEAQKILSDLRDESLSLSREATVHSLSTEGWGILEELPSGVSLLNQQHLEGAISIKYHIMETFKETNATNYCGAVAAMNVLEYYSAYLDDYELIKPNANNAFLYLYQNTGNGSFTTPAKLRSALTSYISNRKSQGMLVNEVNITTQQYTERTTFYSNMVSCIGSNKMPLMVIWKGVEAHWVNILGYTSYRNGDCYVRIVDNWNEDGRYFYKFMSANALSDNISALISVRITK